MNLKKWVIELYNKKYSLEEISKNCSVPVEMVKNIILNYERMLQSKQMQLLMNKLKRLNKNAKDTKYDKSNILEEIKDVCLEILKIEPNNEFAMNELLVNSYIRKQYDDAREYGKRVLENNPVNVYTLYNMAKLEMRTGNYNEALKYNKLLLKIDEKNAVWLAQKDEIERRNLRQKQIDRINREKEERKESITKEKRQIAPFLKKEKEQYEHAEEIMDKYTIEGQIEYMQKIKNGILDGSINSKNIEMKKEELYKYPDKMQAVLFMSEIYYMITEKEEIAIGELDKYLETIGNDSKEERKIIQDRISEFRKRINVREYLETKEAHEYMQLQNERKEQDEYMNKVAKDFEEGKITKKDVLVIARKLEQFHDSYKAIVIIVKMYEKFYEKKDVLEVLALYSQIPNLTIEEKQFIVDAITRTKTRRGEPANKCVQKVIKGIKSIDDIGRSPFEKNKTYKISIETQKVVDLLHQGKTVLDIHNKLNISIKSIAKIRDNLLDRDEEFKQKHSEDVELAKLFLRDGYTAKQVYDLLEGNVSYNHIIEMKTQEGIINKRGRKPKKQEDVQK